MGKAKSLLATRENNRCYEGKIDFQEINYMELLAFLNVFTDDSKPVIAKALLYEHDFLDKNPIFREFLEFMANEYLEQATGENYNTINDRYFSFAKIEYSLKIKDILKLSTLKIWGVTEQDINIYQNAVLADYIDTEKSLNKTIIRLQSKMIDELNAKIAELQAGEQANTPADKELSAVSQKALTKLLYALFCEHGYELDGTRKGTTNDRLQTLTKSYNVEINRETIATWLDRVNALKFDLQK